MLLVVDEGIGVGRGKRNRQHGELALTLVGACQVHVLQFSCLCIFNLAQPEAVERGLPAHHPVAASALLSSDLDPLVEKAPWQVWHARGLGGVLHRLGGVYTPDAGPNGHISPAKVLSRWIQQTDNTVDRGTW